MDTSAFDGPPAWAWPNDTIPSGQSQKPGNSQAEQEAQPGSSKEEAQAFEQAKWRKRYRPRTCRICLETVLPTYIPPSENLPSVLQSGPSVTYISSDPADGRLVRPCQCKGSSKYVHENCLRSWRHADPSYGRRNYYQCPTCRFQYRIERMQWGRWISSAGTQMLLTVLILFLVMFLLGFVADPIINLYLDPYTTISTASKLKSKVKPIVVDEDSASWTEHFIKGLASLGLLSFVKVLLALSPWQWYNLRGSGFMSGGGRAGGTGRERLASISWVVVLVGVGTFLWTVYKGIRAFTRRTLDKAAERVVDVHGDDDDDDDEDDKTDEQEKRNETKKER